MPTRGRDKAHCDKLLEMSMNYNLEQVNRTPAHQGRILDLLFISHPGLVQRLTVFPPIGPKKGKRKVQ